MRESGRTRSLVAGLLIGLVACTTVQIEEEEIPDVRADARYDLLFPYYVELCAVSQIRSNFAPHGGSPGHAAMYIKGACRDPSTDFPTLRVCGPEVDLTDPESGTGVSVNKVLRNVNWLAVPGKRLFFFGDLEPDELLDADSGIAALVAADESGVFDGIDIHPRYWTPPDDEDAQLYFAAAETLGTDFALNFGRTLFCARLPLDRPQLVDVIQYLNDLNRDYALGGQDYDWSGYNDNCAHTLHNSLAAAGVWKHKSVASYRLGQLANLSVPANEFAELALLSMDFPLEDFDRVLGDPVLRRTLTRRDWLPVRHGAMIEVIPVHQHNELYETDAAIFMLTNPLRRSKERRVNALVDDPRNTDLEANLRHFQVLYREILAGRPPGFEVQPDDDAKTRARAHYYDYVEAQLAEVNEMLERLGALD